MSAAFAFLHHVAAFALVAAVALEFVLTRGEPTLATARRLLARIMHHGTFRRLNRLWFRGEVRSRPA